MDRLWDRAVRTESGCLEWQGASGNSGHGIIRFNGKRVGTHRAAYELTYGEIPEGMFVCHACDNPPCIEPTHLWVGTPSDNVRDMIRKGRHGGSKLHKEECDHGHQLTPENTYAREVTGVVGKITLRSCRECKRKSNREYMRRERSAGRFK